MPPDTFFLIYLQSSTKLRDSTIVKVLILYSATYAIACFEDCHSFVGLYECSGSSETRHARTNNHDVDISGRFQGLGQAATLIVDCSLPNKGKIVFDLHDFGKREKLVEVQ